MKVKSQKKSQKNLSYIVKDLLPKSPKSTFSIQFFFLEEEGTFSGFTVQYFFSTLTLFTKFSQKVNLEYVQQKTEQKYSTTALSR